MFEDLDKALARQSQKLDPAVVNRPAIINNLDDIKRVLSEIDPKYAKPAPEVELSALLNVSDDGGNVTYRVTAPSRSKSKREILLDGFDQIKRQIEASERITVKLEPTEVNGVVMQPPQFGNGWSGQVWIDPLIRHWLGGYRNGLTVCWDLHGSRYQYDIYEHRLNRVSNE